jgi:hypothetical protein
MTDQPSGSTPQGGQPQGTPSGTPASPVVSDTSWLSGLQDAGNRDLVTKKGWDKSNSPDVVIHSYRELEGRLGKAIVVPAANAPKEDYDKVYTALGKPKTPGDYAFRLPQGLDQNFPYDDAFATEYKNWSHEADLSPRQAQMIHDRFVTRFANQLNAAAEGMQRKVGQAHQEILAKWGPTDGDGYRVNLDHAKTGLRGLGLAETFKAAGLISGNGDIADAKLAFALATVGEGLFREDKMRGGSPGHFTESNPWKDGQENLAEQGRIHRENPELARSLITAAGKSPDKALFKNRFGKDA